MSTRVRQPTQISKGSRTIKKAGLKGLSERFIGGGAGDGKEEGVRERRTAPIVLTWAMVGSFAERRGCRQSCASEGSTVNCVSDALI